jgi:hypothetical protein
MKVRFNIKQLDYQNVPHQKVFISGNNDAMGNWDENKAIPLFTSQYSYPAWTMADSIGIDKLADLKDI